MHLKSSSIRAEVADFVLNKVQGQLPRKIWLVFLQLWKNMKAIFICKTNPYFYLSKGQEQEWRTFKREKNEHENSTMIQSASINFLRFLQISYLIVLFKCFLILMVD